MKKSKNKNSNAAQRQRNEFIKQLTRLKKRPGLAKLFGCLTLSGWLSAKRINYLINFDARKTRELAAASEGHIISGPKGYHITIESTRKEVEHAIARLRSQARKMDYRADEIANIAGQ